MRVNFHKTIFMLVMVLCINSHVDAQTLTKYAKQKQQEIVERQRIEKQKYEEVCQKGTLSAFQEYAKLYPNGKYITEINNRIEDFPYGHQLSQITLYLATHSIFSNQNTKPLIRRPNLQSRNLNHGKDGMSSSLPEI